MADLICGHVNDSGLAISKCPAPGIRIRRTWSPACVAASTYASTSANGTKSSCDPSTSTCGIAKRQQLDRRRLCIVIWHRGRRATEERGDDCIAAQSLISRDIGRHVDRSSQVHDPAHRKWVCDVQLHLPSEGDGVPRSTSQDVRRPSARQRRRGRDRGGTRSRWRERGRGLARHRGRCRATRCPVRPSRRYSMFHVAIRSSLRASPIAPKYLGCRVGGLEATAVDEDDEGMGSGAVRNPQFRILARVAPVGDAMVWRSARNRRQLPRRHQRPFYHRTTRLSVEPDRPTDQQRQHDDNAECAIRHAGASLSILRLTNFLLGLGQSTSGHQRLSEISGRC